MSGRSSTRSNTSDRRSSRRCPRSTPCSPRCPTTFAPTCHRCGSGICGAAPASAELLRRFETRCGFPHRGLRPVRRQRVPPPSTRSPVNVRPALWGSRSRVSASASSTKAVPMCRPASTVKVIIAGPNVMRGYLGRPDETCARHHRGLVAHR